jgi:hypothetical protein
MDTSQNVIDLLNMGVNEKRNRNYTAAIDCYLKATEIDPFYPVTHLNTAKVLLGTNRYDLAFRHLLTNLHLRMLEETEITTPDYLNFYQLDEDDLKRLRYSNESIQEFITKSPINQKIAKDLNITYYAGLCFLGDNLKILDSFKIDQSYFESEKEIILGKTPVSPNLKQTKIVNLIHILGLKLLTDNLDLQLKDKSQIVRHYTDPHHEIRKLNTKPFNWQVSDYNWWQIIEVLIKVPFMLIPEFIKTIYESFTIKNKKFSSRITDILFFPFIFIFGPIILSISFIVLKISGKKNKTISNEELKSKIMWNIQDLESMINKHAKTNVSMTGTIDADGGYSGHLKGSTTDELYAFIALIANKRGQAFERVDFRLGTRNPLTYTCYLKFDTNTIKL